MGSKIYNGEKQVLIFKHDFLVNPINSAGTFKLGDLPTGFVIQSLRVVEKEAITATATIALGEDGGGDADGYLAATDVSNTRGAGALLYDNTEKEPLEYVVADDKDGLVMTVGTVNAVAGKLVVYVDGYQS